MPGPLHAACGSRATQLGEFHLFCAEYCGTRPFADGRAHRRDAAGRLRALARRPAPAQPGMAQHGFALFRAARLQRLPRRRARRVHAPPLDGLLRPHACTCRTAARVVADENYLRDSILLPRKDVVAGFAPVMPSFAGQVSEEDIQALIAYLQLDRRKRRRAMSAPSYLDDGLHAALVADDARPQAHRDPLRDRDHRVLLRRRRRRDADPARAR